jgi:hypothetical protein
MKSLLSRIYRGTQGAWHSLSDRPAWKQTWVVKAVGLSAGGRTIGLIEIGEGEKPVLFVGQIHGNEVGTQKLVLRLAHWLEKNHERWPHLKFILIPSINPDGAREAERSRGLFSHGRLGRFNGNNVDLNRNFDVPNFKSDSHWNRGRGYAEREPVFCGERGGSEPETTLLCRLAKVHEPELSVFFHSVASDVNPGNDDRSRELAKIFSEVSGYENYSHERWLKLEQTGTAREWFSRAKLPYLEIEGSVRWGSDWKKQKAAIEACIDLL